MRENYDFSHARKNPYATKLKRQISIRLDVETIDYFKKLAGESEISYQKLINLYLAECAAKHVKPKISWIK